MRVSELHMSHKIVFYNVFSVLSSVSAASELPDIFTQKCTRICQNGHKNEFFVLKATLDNFEDVLFARVWKTLDILRT